jgi:lipopolysaccharide transport system permease protein
MQSEQLTVYRPNQRQELSIAGTIAIMIRNTYSARDLISVLFMRDMVATYRKSFLGLGWHLIAPILAIVSWLFLQSTGLLTPGDTGVPYPFYVLVGSSIWGLFSNSYTAATQTLTSGAELLLQINYPHESLLVKQMLVQVVNFTIGLVVVLAVCAGFQVFPAWQIVFLPLVVLPLIILASGLGLIVSVISVVVTDISRITVVVMQILMYLTPVIYSPDTENKLLQAVIQWNPLTYFICSARDVIFYGDLYDARAYFICTFLSFGLLIAALRLFYVSENRVIERMY